MSSTTRSSAKRAVPAIFLLAAALFAFGRPSWCQSNRVNTLAKEQTLEEVQNKTLSPYFFVQSDDPTLDQMPLKATQVEVSIVGVIADVKVTQVYKNEGKRPIEAIYVFPASIRAAVYGMKMTIGERTITAAIRKREEARQAYEQAKNEGRSASLLEQQRPNVFQMNVTNILPGDEIRSELHYTELLTPTDKIYEFVYPTVVGPRYSNQASQSADKSDQWIENPYLQQGQSPSSKLAISVHLDCGLPIHDLTCSSHRIDSKFLSRSAAGVNLAEAEAFAGNRDFVLKYRLAGERIESGLLLHRSEEENFFLLLMQPPERVTERNILPREYVFIVDVSGSMHGFPLETSKRLLANLIGALRPTDRFNVVLFAGGSQIFSAQSVPAGEKNIRSAIDLIDQERGGGGTELLPALKKAFGLPLTEGFSRTLIIATDGYVAVEKEAFEFVRAHLGDCNFFTFGIGSSVNRYLIEGMARAGMGESFVVSRAEDAAVAAEKFRLYVQSPILSKVKVAFTGFDAFEVEPMTIPDVFADRPVVVRGKWRGEAKGKIALRGVSGNGEYQQQIEVKEKDAAADNSALKYLWARSRIAQLDDDHRLSADQKVISELTALGLKYHLLTAYTSFVAIDEQVRLRDGKPTTVKQPLPLPEGVSNYAVGEVAAAPPAASGSSDWSAMGGFLKGWSAHAPAVNNPADGRLQGAKERQTASDLEKSNECRVELRQLEAAGALSKDTVEKVLAANLAKIQSCLCKAAQASADAKVVVRWRVNASGRVEGVEIEPREGVSKAVQNCIAEALRQLTFAGGKASTAVKATFELIR